MRKIAWRITPPSVGSGGFRTVCKKIKALQRRGHECHAYVAPDAVSMDDADTVSAHIKSWYDCSPDGVCLKESIPAGFDTVIATAWDTAIFAAGQDAPCKLYFIQDYEPWFYSLNYDRIKAERSYDLGLKPITMGRCLSWKLSTKKGLDGYFCDFGADLSVYQPLDSRVEHAVYAIYQPEKDGRLAKLLEETVLVLLDSDPNVKIHLYGSDACFLPFEERVVNHGLISLQECNELYNSVVCGISTSGSNPSRIPFEMMAAGLPVMDLYLENNLFDFPNEAIDLVDASSEAVASGALRLLGNAELRAERSMVARAWMLARDSSVEDAMFCDAVEQCLSVKEGGCSLDLIQGPLYSSGVSGVLPSALESYELRQRSITHDRVLAKTRVAISSFKIVVGCPPSFLESPSQIRLVTWTLHDQSDLKWCLGSLCEDGILLEGDLFCECNTVASRFFHIYWFQGEENPILLCDAIQATKESPLEPVMDDRNYFSRKLTVGSIEITFAFYGDRQMSSTWVPGIGKSYAGIPCADEPKQKSLIFPKKFRGSKR